MPNFFSKYLIVIIIYFQYSFELKKNTLICQNSFFFMLLYYVNYFYYRLNCLVDRVFAECPEDLGSIPGCVTQKTFKMILDASLLKTQQNKVRIKGKEEHFRERSSALAVVAIEKGAIGSPSTTVANFTYLQLLSNINYFTQLN